MSTSAIEKFLDRYDKAVQGHSKELRLQLPEAKALAHEVTMLLARSSTLADKIIILQEQLIQEQNSQPGDVIKVSMDGGDF